MGTRPSSVLPSFLKASIVISMSLGFCSFHPLDTTGRHGSTGVGNNYASSTEVLDHKVDILLASGHAHFLTALALATADSHGRNHVGRCVGHSAGTWQVGQQDGVDGMEAVGQVGIPRPGS